MRAAVVGTNWGSVHVAALQEAGVDVVAVAGKEKEQTREAARRWDVPHAVTDLGALHSLDLDLVTIATPASTHADVLAAVPDVPVICEKPAVGLSPLRRLPAGRSAPVRVNYAFAFLDVSERAAGHLHRLGAIRSAHAVSSYEMPELAFTPEEMFMELLPHPWSWLVRLFGVPSPASPGSRQEQASGGIAISVECGQIPVALASVPEPGLDGIRHDVVIEGVNGVLTLSGRYRRGQGWRFEAPAILARPHDGSARPAEVEEFGLAESAPPDPWDRANSRSIAAIVEELRGRRVPPLLFGWDDALEIDRTAQAAIHARD